MVSTRGTLRALERLVSLQNPELDPAVELAALLRGVVGDGLVRAMAHGLEPVVRDAAMDEIGLHRFRSAQGKLEVRVVVALARGVARDLDAQLRVRRQD